MIPDGSAVDEASPAADALARVLVVDDDALVRELIARVLRHDGGYAVEVARGPEMARAALDGGHYDVVVTDLHMPGQDGLSLMQWARDRGHSADWIVLTGHGTFDAAVRALQLGAYDFITKPLTTMTPLLSSVAHALERRRLQAALERANEDLRTHVEQLESALGLLRDQADTMQADLARAAMIQRALLPPSAPTLPGVRFDAVYRPSQHIGGDLYDAVRVGDHHVALLIADAAGHGLSAAMLSVIFRQKIPLSDPTTGAPVVPAAALVAVNAALCEGLAARGLFVTAVYALIDVSTRRVRLASAGHPPVLHLRNGNIDRLLHTGPALGLDPHARWSEHQFTLTEGDRLLLHTDGVYRETVSPVDALAAQTEALADQSGPQLVAALASEAPPGIDDVTVVLLTASAGPSTLDHGEPPQAEAAALVATHGDVQAGTESGRAGLAIVGRGDWSSSCAYYDAGRAAVDRGDTLTLDFARCEFLDSTLLGTIHDLVGCAERAGCEVVLQGITPPVAELFEELGMQRVIDHVRLRTVPLPRSMRSVVTEIDDRARADRLLSAHEGLARLNAQNRRAFDPLVRMLRAEIDR